VREDERNPGDARLTKFGLCTFDGERLQNREQRIRQ